VPTSLDAAEVSGAQSPQYLADAIARAAAERAKRAAAEPAEIERV